MPKKSLSLSPSSRGISTFFLSASHALFHYCPLSLPLFLFVFVFTFFVFFLLVVAGRPHLFCCCVWSVSVWSATCDAVNTHGCGTGVEIHLRSQQVSGAELFHGANGGSTEECARDHKRARTKRTSTSKSTHTSRRLSILMPVEVQQRVRMMLKGGRRRR